MGVSGWAYQIIKLSRCDTTIHTRDDLLGDGNGVDMVHIKAVAEAGDTCCDLVELNAFLTPV